MTKFLICALTVLIFYPAMIISQDVLNNEASIPSDAIISGIWENGSKIISIVEDEDGLFDAQITLKTFYTYYYDGIYPVDSSVPVNLVRIDDNLYIEYWEKGQAYATLGNPIVQEHEEDPVFKVKIERPMKFDVLTAELANGELWLPKTNTLELSLDETIISDEVIGYYIDDTTTYAIRYWLTDFAYNDEKVELSLIERETESSVFVDKYISIGEYVYTSATGLRTNIRNVTTVPSIKENAIVSVDNSILTLSDPYMYLSDIKNVDDAILAHNSIPRPPRDGRAYFVEPSIYKKLEKMTIEDFDNPYAPIH